MTQNVNYFSLRNKKNSVKNYSKIASFPKNALIELTNACNHQCVFCNNPRMTRKIGNIDEKIFYKFIDEASKLGLNEVGLYATGEPFLTKKLDTYVKFCKDHNIKNVYITTNGSLAKLERVKKIYDAGLDSIKFSINASTRETYKIIHGKDHFNEVLKNIDQIYNWNKKNQRKLRLYSSFIYTKLTEKEIHQYKQKFSKYFEDMLIHPADTQGGRINNIIEKISPIKIKKDSSKLKPCDMIWNRIHLTCEGYLTACCVDYDLDLVYADYKINEIKLDQIWNNNLIMKLREKHINGNLDNSLCKNCLLGTREKYKKLKELNIKRKNYNKDTNLTYREKVSSQG